MQFGKTLQILGATTKAFKGPVWFWGLGLCNSDING